MRRLVRRAAARAGLDTAPAGVYSPVPELPPRGDPAWRREYPLEVDDDAQMAFLEAELAPYLGEAPGALERLERHGFSLWNGQYQGGDAEVLYALLRHLLPRRVLELGSGFSTLVSAAACAANAAEGDVAELVAVDPEPNVPRLEGVDAVASVERRDCRELPLERFLALEAGDVLFIDTSHVVKLGSEVNWLVLEVLPRLAPGVWVHFHDVFLPYEYPRYLLALEAYFNEQYLLQAFLEGNSDWEVRLALSALFRRQRERFAALVPSVAEDSPDPRWADVSPAAFWLRRREAGG